MLLSKGSLIILISCLSPLFKVPLYYFFVLGTMRVYLGTLALFYKFVLCDKALDSSIQSQCSPMMATVKNWSDSYKNRTRTSELENMRRKLRILRIF